MRVASASGILYDRHSSPRTALQTSRNDIMTTPPSEDRIKRIDGVGELIQSFGAGYAMRIWLDPCRSRSTS